jgi:hypothetical protein
MTSKQCPHRRRINGQSKREKEGRDIFMAEKSFILWLISMIFLDTHTHNVVFFYTSSFCKEKPFFD